MPAIEQPQSITGIVHEPAQTNGTARVLPGAGCGAWFKDHPLAPEMVVVPSGTFIMGSPDDEPERVGEGHRLAASQGIEGPQRVVRIERPFGIGRCAVTVDEFAAFVHATGRVFPDRMYTFEDETWAERAGRCWHNPGFRQGGRNPVVGIDWADANAYVAWLTTITGETYRLPSEAEWEYAARAGASTAYWWGRTIGPDQANYSGGTLYEGGGRRGFWRRATLPVDYSGERFAPNAWGLLQVHGNVWEWCADALHLSYAGAPLDGTAWVSGGDPGRRIVRGGAFDNGPRNLRAARRDRAVLESRYACLGLRVVRQIRA